MRRYWRRCGPVPPAAAPIDVIISEPAAPPERVAVVAAVQRWCCGLLPMVLDGMKGVNMKVISE